MIEAQNEKGELFGFERGRAISVQSAAAIVAAAHSIPRGIAFAIFVGSANLSGARGAAFVTGIHTALYLGIALMLVAAFLSGTRLFSTTQTVAHSAPSRPTPVPGRPPTD